MTHPNAVTRTAAMLLLRLVVTSLGVNVIAGMPQTANVRNNENQQGPLPSSSSPAYDSTRDLPEKLFKTLILTGIGVEAARRIWVAGVNEGLKRQGPLPQHPPADGGDIVDEEIAITVDDVKMSLRLYHWLGYLTGACVADRSAEFVSPLYFSLICLRPFIPTNRINRRS